MSHTLNLLGKTLAELAPFMEEAMRALDKPGTRALRRKIDGQFHFVVGAYDLVRRESLSDYDCSKVGLPRYERATAVWPGRVAHEGRKAQVPAELTADLPRTPVPGLQLVVDNTRAARVPLTVTQVEGGAA